MFAGLREKSPPVSAYGVPLAICNASVRSRARIIASTGPKISSCAIAAVGATSAKTCGATKNPSSASAATSPAYASFASALPFAM